MAVRELKLMGNDVLRSVAEPVPVDKITSKEVQTLIDDMIETASRKPDAGFVTAGLAAPQVGVSKRIVLVMSPQGEKKRSKFDVYINPQLKFPGDTLVDSKESCLSTPHICGVVKRYDQVKVTYYDREGRKQRVKFSDDWAIYVQHEVDHLDGILWIDKVEDTRTIAFC